MAQDAIGELEPTEQSSPDEFRSPVKKLTKFFRRSRDGWKRKARTAKQQCKLLGNQVRAVERSRASWRTKALEAGQQLRQLQQELEALKRSRGT